MEHTLLQLYITVMCKYSYCLVAFCIEQCLNQWLKEVCKMVDDGIVLPWLAKFVEISVIIAGNFEAAEYFGRQLTGDIFTLSVCRENFWQGAFMFYKRGADLNRPFRVSFEGIELGIDTGGPRREFFQLLADNMTTTDFRFFEGDIPNLLPAMKGPALRLGHFRIIGTMIAYSIVNGGIGNVSTFHTQ